MFVSIKRFYKKEQIKAMYFGYINALMFNIPNATIEHCIKNFMKHHKFDEETFNMNSALQEYQRMRKDYIETEKTEQS